MRYEKFLFLSKKSVFLSCLILSKFWLVLTVTKVYKKMSDKRNSSKMQHQCFYWKKLQNIRPLNKKQGQQSFYKTNNDSRNEIWRLKGCRRKQKLWILRITGIYWKIEKETMKLEHAKRKEYTSGYSIGKENETIIQEEWQTIG